MGSTTDPPSRSVDGGHQVAEDEMVTVLLAEGPKSQFMSSEDGTKIFKGGVRGRMNLKSKKWSSAKYDRNPGLVSLEHRRRKCEESACTMNSVRPSKWVWNPGKAISVRVSDGKKEKLV